MNASLLFRSLLAASALTLSLAVPARPVHAFTEDSFATIRARYAGKPLVVHIWGMTCGPCIVELPQWGILERKRPGMNLVLIQADQAPAPASEQTLEQAGLGKVESWGVTSELDEYLRASIDPKWVGDMPRTLLISPSGEITRLRGVANLDDVDRWLDRASPGK
jgi:hypothetical protein